MGVSVVKWEGVGKIKFGDMGFICTFDGMITLNDKKQRLEIELGGEVLKVLEALGKKEKRSRKNYIEFILESHVLSQRPAFVKQTLQKK